MSCLLIPRVIGCSRVPEPPARTIPFTPATLPAWTTAGGPALVDHRAGTGRPVDIAAPLEVAAGTARNRVLVARGEAELASRAAHLVVLGEDPADDDVRAGPA